MFGTNLLHTNYTAVWAKIYTAFITHIWQRCVTYHLCLTFRGPCIMIYSYNKSKRGALPVWNRHEFLFKNKALKYTQWSWKFLCNESLKCLGVIPEVKCTKHTKHALTITAACAAVILVSSLNLTLLVPFKMDNKITLGQITILEQDCSKTLKLYAVSNRQKFINSCSRSVVIQH